MSRTQVNLKSTNAFHITSRCHNRSHFPLPLEDVWRILTDYLYFTKFAFGLRIYSFVLMPNHFHLVVSAPNQNLSEAMRYFLRETSRVINYESRQINQLWGGRFFRCELKEYQYLLNTYKYVYQNPVRSKAVIRAEDYPFSTLHALVGYARHSVLTHDDLIFGGTLQKNLDWINRVPSSIDLHSVQCALRRKEFSLPKINGICNPLEKDFL